MSACIFIASDMPLNEVKPSMEYPVHINIDKGKIYDGGAEDNFYLSFFEDAADYCDKEYAVLLDWNYTSGSAKQLIEYIKLALRKSEEIELWHAWRLGYYEFEERPFVHRKTISIDELRIEDIKELEDSAIWNTPDRYYPKRPSFYCIRITR